MRLDTYMTRCLRIAFRIYGMGKDGQFWIDMASTRWDEVYDHATVPPEVWDEVRLLIRTEFPQLVHRNRRIWNFMRSEGTSPE